jgi:hypothetical protein
MNTYSVIDHASGWSVDVNDGSGLPERYGQFETEADAQLEAARLAAFEATLTS